MKKEFFLLVKKMIDSIPRHMGFILRFTLLCTLENFFFFFALARVLDTTKIKEMLLVKATDLIER